jgi:hypothetical protein
MPKCSVSHGCNDWMNHSSRLKSFENSPDHIGLQCVLKWLKPEKRLKCGKVTDIAIHSRLQ